MNWNFDWQTPRRIVFGDGRFAELGAIASQYGRRVALVTCGRSLRAGGRLDDLAAQFDRAGIDWLQLRIDHEPTVEAVDALTAEAAGFRPDMVVAMGGGSAMDTGKAVAALLTNGGEVLDYLEGVGRGRTLERPALPVIAVPTTAGTGTEATKNAVIGERARTFKKSMRSDGMMPVVAVVDPELTHGCPPQVTAASGMDALTQLLETYTSNRAHVMSDAVAREGLQRVAAIDRLADGVLDAEQERTLRASMSYAALLGGMLLANVGLGAVHGLVSPLSGRQSDPARCGMRGPAAGDGQGQRAAGGARWQRHPVEQVRGGAGAADGRIAGRDRSDRHGDGARGLPGGVEPAARPGIAR